MVLLHNSPKKDMIVLYNLAELPWTDLDERLRVGSCLLLNYPYLPWHHNILYRKLVHMLLSMDMDILLLKMEGVGVVEVQAVVGEEVEAGVMQGLLLHLLVTLGQFLLIMVEMH